MIGLSITETTLEDVARAESLAKPTRKKSKGASPTARSLAECRKRGWLAGVVERRLPRKFVTVDLFGFIDVVVLDGKPGLLAIQATGETASGNVSLRVKKITIDCADAARRWLAAGNRIEVWGWGKRGGAGKRKLWTLRVVPIESVDGLRDLTLEAAHAS